ncbi:hypothetical protein B0H13DRAFT_2081789 [Mycena leptocephala]|nr:hypothetical protein B0H13DRAFT_2081789 [Mycena leptocephala]
MGRQHRERGRREREREGAHTAKRRKKSWAPLLRRGPRPALLPCPVSAFAPCGVRSSTLLSCASRMRSATTRWPYPQSTSTCASHTLHPPIPPFHQHTARRNATRRRSLPLSTARDVDISSLFLDSRLNQTDQYDCLCLSTRRKRDYVPSAQEAICRRLRSPVSHLIIFPLWTDMDTDPYPSHT